MYREVTMIEVREVLRLRGEGLPKKRIAAQLGLDPKTVRRYLTAAATAGVRVTATVSDEEVRQVLLALYPASGRPRGDGWARCLEQRAAIERWLRDGLRLTKIRKLLLRQGIDIAYPTLHRFAVLELQFGKTATTIPVFDGEPGHELQLDTGWVGWLTLPQGKKRRFRAWIVIACCTHRDHPDRRGLTARRSVAGRRFTIAHLADRKVSGEGDGDGTTADATIREILRLKWRLKRSHRDTARSLGISPGAVASVLSRATAIGLRWEGLDGLTDDALEQRLYGPKLPGGVARPVPDPTWIHTELRRAGVTLELLHLEYLQQHPDGYRYSAFCRHYREWLGRQRVSMRQVHKAGEKLFVDYSGKKPEIVDPSTGVVRPVELFVAVVGASNYTYAEATESQRSADFIQSHGRALEYLAGVPAAIVPDQLKSGVRDACRYEPVLQRTYEEWAAHYGTVILPARPAKPRDKAKVEVGVQVAQRWILARVRHETFFSLAALNTRIRALLDELNARPMKGYAGQSRRDLFLRFDRPALRPLPAERFVYTEWCQARVNIDYHIDIERHFYSVPHRLIHQTVDVRLSATTVEVFQRGTRLWVHRRSPQVGGFTTMAEHMPHAHRAHLEWSPSRLIRWGATVGPQTAALIEQILASRPHPEQGYRSCLGLLRLTKQYGPDRVEAASGRAVAVGARSYRHVQAMLKHGLDRLPLDTTDASPPRAGHANVRGPAYYQQELPHAD